MEYSFKKFGKIRAKTMSCFILQLDSSLKRLHTEENNKQTTLLTDNIMSGDGALDLLKLLGFHFQSKGSSLNNPYVIYPHWNRDELLIPTYDALRALLGKLIQRLMCVIVYQFIFIMPPFKEMGVYCFAHVGLSVDKPCPINN